MGPESAAPLASTASCTFGPYMPGPPNAGPTVHYVDEQYDRGPIIAQWPVPVRPGDSAETLAARVLAAEHRLLPRVVRALADRREWTTPVRLHITNLDVEIDDEP